MLQMTLQQVVLPSNENPSDVATLTQGMNVLKIDVKFH
jgi:hypothetical protein